MIGQGGLSPAVKNEFETAIGAHELIKVRARVGDRDERDQILQSLAEQTGSTLVQRIGNVGVFHSLRGLGEDFDDMPEAGWVLRADKVGQGLAREAMTAALAWFEREHGRQRIVCMISPGNAPSIGLAERLGFVRMREARLPDGEAVRLFERLPG